MFVVFSAMGVGFAALGLWLTIRMINRRQRWSTRQTVCAAVAALPLIYAFSFGPTCWFHARTGQGGRALVWIYRPILSQLWNHQRRGPISRYCHELLGGAIQAWAEFGAGGNSLIAFDPQDGLFWSATTANETEEGLVPPTE